MAWAIVKSQKSDGLAKMDKLPLNVPELPLDEKVLIEASAGTGKTYTIGLIVLRLLLEKLLPIEKIVLITFTKPATAELKKKTAEKIVEAYGIWKNGSDKEDDLTKIIKRAKQEKDVQRKEVNLLDAIARMDEMPVFTIHGFCERLLSEFAFETGNFEEREVITDIGDIKDRVIADFWRREIQNLDELIDLKPQELSRSVNVVLSHPLAKIEGEEYKKTDEEKKIKYAIARKLAEEIREKFADEKKKLKVMDFDDMIENCYKAVMNDSKKILQNAVKKKYEAILVDEFQDTDKMQFEIFDYLFKDKPFFMIGDPKQAIYRFRGGDISTYNKAKKSTGKEPVRMNVNYRSEKSLLDALNLFFKANDFKENVGDEIGYSELECGDTNLKPITERDERYQAFVIWRGGGNENKSVFEPKVQKAVIAEIKRLLSTGKFKPKDIAILLDSNNDCLVYKNALAKERISAIVRGDSVFLSESAFFLRILLNAICHNNNMKFIRALLAHNFIGFEPKEIDEIFEDWANVIYEAKTRLEKYGIMNAIDFFMTEQNLWGRIANGINGERNITNIRQIMELLNEEEIKFGRIPEKINNRFATLCNKAEKNEDTEERLETEENAVKIMTIHKSKGLQFDIVFVPDISRSPQAHRFPDVYMYHNGGEEIIAYYAEAQAAEESSHKAENEESVRLLYVALTRAKFRLYVAFSPCKRNKNGDISEANGASSVCRKIFENFSAQKNITVEDLDDIFENDYSCGESEDEKNIQKIPKYLPSNFSVTPAWSKTSFTGISKNLNHKDYISVPQKIPAGKRMGTLLHSIFENLDFNASEKEIQGMIESKLGGFKEFSGDEGKERKDMIEEWVEVILNRNLQGGAGKLCEIDAGCKVAELNFSMSSEKIDLGEIGKIVKKLEFSETKKLPDKYISGAIDLVFLGRDGKYYILDWKSNSLNGFSQGEMEEAMQNHGYHLQYYIYAVALKRWLEKTQENFDFKKQFGGVYYIFIRGVNEVNFDGFYYASGEEIADSVVKLDESFYG